MARCWNGRISSRRNGLWYCGLSWGHSLFVAEPTLRPAVRSKLAVYRLGINRHDDHGEAK